MFIGVIYIYIYIYVYVYIYIYIYIYTYVYNGPNSLVGRASALGCGAWGSIPATVCIYV